MYLASNYHPTQIFINYRGGLNISPQTPLHASLREVELSSPPLECALSDPPSEVMEREK